MGDAQITLPGWVVVLLIGAVPTLLAALGGLMYDRVKERQYKALIEDLRAEYLAADDKERHDMRNELLPKFMQQGLHVMNWNQFLAMKHPEMMKEFTVKEPQ